MKFVYSGTTRFSCINSLYTNTLLKGNLAIATVWFHRMVLFNGYILTGHPPLVW